MISLYTTIFNLSNFNFDIEEAFSNWFYYVDEVVVTTLKDQLEEVTRAIKSTKFKDSVKIISMDIDINEELYWDGKLKNAALERCNSDVVIQVDFDERISGEKETFRELATEINRHDFPCSIMLPTIDLYEDLNHFVNIGYKWYLHTRKGTQRGAVNFAIKEDGSFDPEKSDTCELIDAEGRLIPCIGKLNLTENDPKIIHLGYLSLESKNKINENFWGKIWNHRKTGIKLKDFIPEKIESGDPRKKPHNIPLPLWKTLN
mgnify:CR=1 FL=1|tara:strand:- start:37 stop:816 length:780 start_codon:yes stop_codon:yes gene_type:complete